MITMKKIGSRTWYLVAVTLGLAVALIDLSAPFGDDSSKLTLLLLITFSGVLGFAQPKRPWRWAFLVGIWLPLVSLAAHALGWPIQIHPTTYSSILLLLPVSLTVCLIAAYAASVVRRALW
jgi:hypothetical protein